MFLIVCFVGWLVCGFAGLEIADKKGRDGVGGFLLGFLLGLIGIAILLLMDDASYPGYVQKDYKSRFDNKE